MSWPRFLRVVLDDAAVCLCVHGKKFGAIDRSVARARGHLRRVKARAIS